MNSRPKISSEKKVGFINDSIILVGQPRSGTTWLGKILDSHPDTLYRHEPDSSQRLSMPLFASAGFWSEYIKLLSQFELLLMNPQPLKTAGKLPLFSKRYISWGNNLARRVSVYQAHLAANLGAKPRVTEFFSAPITAPRIVWKSIESLGRAGIIVQALQPCHVIHLVRHPCGQIHSVLKGEKSGRFESSIPLYRNFDLMKQMLGTEQASAHDLAMERLREMTPVQRLAWIWVIFNDHALSELEGQNNSTTVVYDDFCLDPIKATRRLFKEVDLEWHPQVEKFISRSTSEHSNLFYSIRKIPVRAANSWIHSMNVEDIDQIMDITSRSRMFIKHKFGDTTAQLAKVS
jgi:hypothetical protein